MKPPKDPRRAALTTAMNKRRREFRMTWADVAREAGVVPSTIYAVRDGRYPEISEFTQDGLERALHLRQGSIAAFLAGETSELPAEAPRLPDLVARHQDNEVVMAIWAETEISEETRLVWIGWWLEQAVPARRVVALAPES